MERMSLGEFYTVRCPLCDQLYLARKGDFQLVSQLAHAVAAKKEHEEIQGLSNKTWESVLVRKVIPFPKQKEVHNG